MIDETRRLLNFVRDLTERTDGDDGLTLVAVGDEIARLSDVADEHDYCEGELAEEKAKLEAVPEGAVERLAVYARALEMLGVDPDGLMLFAGQLDPLLAYLQNTSGAATKFESKKTGT